MPSIHTDVIIEIGVWTILLYILPVFVNAGLITAVQNSERVRMIFESCVKIVNVKFHDWISIIESNSYNVLHKKE